MSRLPIPGSDDGTWGDILNTYLEVSLNSDGTLANNTVGTNQIQNNAVTNAKLDSSTQSSVTKANSSVQTVNSKTPTSGDVTLTASDVSAVPITRQVNGKALSSDITLSATDVSAIPNSQKGAVSGVATLDGSSTLTFSQIPSSVVTTSSPSAIIKRSSQFALRDTISVLDFPGVVGDGANDDTAGIQAAANAAVAANNSVLLFPAGYTFMLNPVTAGSTGNIINLGGACEIYVDRGCIIRVMASSATYAWIFGPGAVNNDMTGFRVIGGGTIDGNSATRISAGVIPTADTACGAIHMGIGSHQKVIGLRFTNFDAIWVVTGSSDDIANASDFEVAYCQFDNLGNTIPSQAHDFSCIYFDAIGMHVHHNVFWQGNPGGQSSRLGGSAPSFVTNYGARTAIETHGSGAHVHHNQSYGLPWGGQLNASSNSWMHQDFSGSYNSIGQHWHDNDFQYCGVGIQVAPYNVTSGNYYGLEDVDIHNNSITIDPSLWNKYLGGGGPAFGGVVLASGAQSGSMFKLRIIENDISVTPNNTAMNSFSYYASAGNLASSLSLQLGGTNPVRDWTIARNTIDGSLYDAITVLADAIDGLKVKDNICRDVGLYPNSIRYAVVVEASGGPILNTEIANNVLIDDQTSSNKPYGYGSHTANGLIYTNAPSSGNYQILDNSARCADGASLTSVQGFTGNPGPIIRTASATIATTTAAIAYRSGALSLVGGWNLITIDTITSDTGNNMDVTTNHRYNVPTAGIYQVEGQVLCTVTGGVTLLICSIWKNGSEILRGNWFTLDSVTNGDTWGTSVSGKIFCNEGDYLQLYLYDEPAGGSLSIDTGFSNRLSVCIASA